VTDRTRGVITSSRVKKVVGLCVAVSVVLGLGARAGAQNIEILPPDAPPPRHAPATPPDAPPEVTPATPAEATPPEATPATPPEAPATTPAETPAAAAPVAAAAFGDAWHYAISIERALGFDHISQTESLYGTDSKTTATNFTLFGVPSTGALAAFSFPRAAFDLFLGQDFSVGIGLGLLYGSTTSTPSNGNSTEASYTGVLAAPRIGYALNLAPDVTLWARGGVSVIYGKVSPDAGSAATQSGSSHLVAATIELPVLFTLLPHLAVTVGPTLDVTFSGHLTRPNFGYGAAPSFDQSITELGIQGGVLLYL
jgi:hypothetical protein